MKSLRRKLCIVLIALILFAMLGWFGWRIQNQRIGESKMTALLAGDTNMQVVGLEISNQQRLVRCTDREMTDFISEAIRHHSVRGGGAGVVYRASFKFQGGGQFVTDIYLIGSGFSISMPDDAAEPTFPTHDINFVQPIPAKVSDLFSFLDEPWEKVAGSVWIAEEGKSVRIEHDDRLVAH